MRSLLALVAALAFFGALGCGSQVPPPPRDPDAPVLTGGAALIPGQRIEVKTASGEHFTATVRSVAENGFEVAWKQAFDEPSRTHDDFKRKTYTLEEMKLLQTTGPEPSPRGPSRGGAIGVGVVFLLVAAAITLSVSGIF